jgi:PAS domain S-box-containing protein
VPPILCAPPAAASLQLDPGAFATAVITACADAVVGLDVADAVVCWNPAAERLFGYAAAEIIGQPFARLVPSDGMGELAEIVGRVHAGETVTCETVGVARDGRRLDVLLTSAPIRDADGRIVGRTTTLVDISTRLREQAERRLTEERLALALDSAEDGYWDWDVETGASYLSPRWYRLLGYEPGDLPAHVDTWERLLHPDDQARVRAAVEAHVAGVTPQYEAEERLRHRDGHWVWVLARGKVVARATTDGRAVRVVGTLVDISARKAAELKVACALREADLERRRLQAVIDALPVGVLVAAADGAIIQFSERLAHIMRGRYLATSTADYSSYRAWWADTGAPIVSDEWALARALRSGTTSMGELIEIERLDGTRGTILNSAAPVRDGDGRVVGAVAAVMDVTEQRRVEVQLQHAQKLEAVGKLAGGVAHDFNNLLTVITGNLELVRETVRDALPPGDPTHADLDEIGRAAERARTLVRQLLAFSRKQPLRPHAVDMGVLVSDSARLLRRLLGAEIQLAVHVTDGPTTVLADPSQLDQVVMNLAVNARDAMRTAAHGHDGAGGTLEMWVEPAALAPDEARAWGDLAPGPYVRLVVRDSGHGMDPDTQAHAFEPFFTTKPAGAGTGLGLATVHGIVRQAGGAVRLDSAPGQGTRVTVLLPAAEPAAAAAASVGTRERRTVAAGRGGVLLVEDENAVRAIARRMLERGGYEVFEARHGRDALLLWRAYRDSIAVVVSDLRMPEMGGRELVAALHADAPELPVVFTSGYTDDGAVDSPGAHQAFVAKPFTSDGLLDAIARVLAAAAR